MSYVQVNPVARLAFTHRGVKDLIKVLHNNVLLYETRRWPERSVEDGDV